MIERKSRPWELKYFGEFKAKWYIKNTEEEALQWMETINKDSTGQL